MDQTMKQNGLTRRGFIRTVGFGGAAAAALGIPGGVDAQAPAAAQAAGMPRRKLGKTGAEVSILCLGGMFDTINNQLLLRQAYNWGVTYWDTAEGYGNGLSEEGFGRFFTRYPETRKNIFLVTKFRTSPPDKLSEALDKGLKRLSTDYVDAFFTHGISEFSQITGVRDWAEQMKKTGKRRRPAKSDCSGSARTRTWRTACSPPRRPDGSTRYIAGICSQMPNLAYLSANVAAALDLTALSKTDRDWPSLISWPRPPGCWPSAGEVISLFGELPAHLHRQPVR